jgi:hypothetical protein
MASLLDKIGGAILDRFDTARERLITELKWWLTTSTVIKREPDFIIGDEKDPHMHRWYIIPRNRFFNIYLHRFMRSDERIMHDHRWWSLSIMLEGGCVEHILDEEKEEEKEVGRLEGDFVFRRAKTLHHIELIPGIPCWTLFMTGPAFREWGFLYPNGQWVHHSLHVPGSVDE